MRNNCMFCIPHELSGIGDICGLTQAPCNGYGKDCLAYIAHSKESRAALKEAIELRKKQKERTADK